jgi:glutathione S-transferase
VPVLAIDAQTFLPESNAILWYLGEGTALVPDDRLQRARTLQWMFFEQYNHEPSIAVARFIRCFLKQNDHPRLPELMTRGAAALAVMERHLQGRHFFVGNALGAADLALFAYTHKAADGGFDLAEYPAVEAWVARCLQQPGVTVMPTP